MGLLDDLAGGRCGVRFNLPAGLTRTSDGRDLAHDAATGITWQCLMKPVRLDLRPRHHEFLIRDAHRCARDIFIGYAAAGEQARPLRTDDPEWSPLIEVTPAERDGVAMLTAIHRMSYQLGDEMLLGHLLVPVRAGLFEIRAFARATTTGLRESILVAQILRGGESQGEGGDPFAAVRRLGQSFYDDPLHDARFPEHPLSRIRAALAWILADSDLEIREPAEPAPEGPIARADLGYAFIPPPRYLAGDYGQSYPQFTRISIAGTDGIHLLSVPRFGRSLPTRDAAAVEALARRIAREEASKGGLARSPAVTVDDPAHARVLVTHADGRHMAHHVFRAADGAVFLPSIDAPCSTPAAELDADLAAMLATLRPLGRSS